MKLFFAGDTDTGCVRSSNQDAFHIDSQGRFFIVADGMGGHAGGEEASRIAVTEIQTYLESTWGNGFQPEKMLQEAVYKANQAILRDQTANPMRADMGTTIVVLLFHNDRPWYCHIGDSRLYRLRGAKLEQLTEDHTWIARAVQAGTITPDQARVHPWRHMLLQCLGREDMKAVMPRSFDMQPGDRLLLCSDGLTEELTDERIRTILKDIRSCDRATRTLIETAKEHGGRDNITVAIVASEMTESGE